MLTNNENIENNYFLEWKKTFEIDSFSSKDSL